MATQEQIDKLGFVPTEAEEAYIQTVADKVSADFKRKKSFEGRRNREAFKRMNRPSKLEAMEKGAEKFMKLLERVGPRVVNEVTGP